jgi:hypothetical protein
MTDWNLAYAELILGIIYYVTFRARNAFDQRIAIKASPPPMQQYLGSARFCYGIYFINAMADWGLCNRLTHHSKRRGYADVTILRRYTLTVIGSVADAL